MKLTSLVLLVLISVATAWSPSVIAKDDVGELLKARRVVFLGDSITYAGQYIAYLETYLTTRFPDQQFEFIDIGLPSETCSGLSEPGHAGGSFPRPDVHERLGRVLEKLKPNLIVACYGMNCGMYHPLNDERFQKYKDGRLRLHAAANAAGVKVIHVTPPTFDPLPLKGRTLPAGRDSYSQPFEGYNDVLSKFSEWLVSQRDQGWAVIDAHGPMDRHLATRREQNASFVLAGDGVHAGPTGHWLLAQEIIAALKLPATVGSLTLDAASGKVQPAEHASAKKGDDGAWLIEWTSGLPMFIDPQWDAESVKLEQIAKRFNQHRLIATGLNGSRFDLFEGETLVATVTSDELKNGVDLTAFGKLSTNVRAAELYKLIQRRQRILTDSWLNEVGHLRPGMAKGLPVAEATTQANQLGGQIATLAKPVNLKLRLSATK